jgi:hypothetical protein
MAQTGQKQFVVLAAKLEELEGVCARLAQENADLCDRVSMLMGGRATTNGHNASGPLAIATGPLPRADGPTAKASPANSDGVISRRGVLGKAFGAAALTVVGTAAVIERGAAPAAAANGSDVRAGAETTAEARTSVKYDGAGGFPGVVLLGNDSTFDGNSASYPAALGGWAGAGSTAGKGGVANGVYGFTDNGNGNGIVGVNTGLVAGSGAGVLGVAYGAKNIGVQATSTAGTAISGSSDSAAANATAIIGVITSPSPGGFSAAVKGQNNGTTGFGIGVWGSQAGAGWGVYASSESGIALNADGGTGTGVNANGATGVTAIGSTTGVTATAPSAIVAKGGTTGVTASGPTAVSATGATVGVSASGPTAVTATGTTLGVSASGPTAVSANGASVGVNASGPTAVTAGGTTVGVNASGPTAVDANGTSVGVNATGPTAITATGTNIGVEASGTTGVSVSGETVGISTSGPTGLSATGNGKNGVAVTASSIGNAPTIHATNSGTGAAVRATMSGGSGLGGTGAVVGDCKAGPGVLGLSEKATGVQGESKSGRGGVFAGGSAQVRLTPGSLGSHPASGQQGDLYCDRTGRLWFCKKGGGHATWKQIA